MRRCSVFPSSLQSVHPRLRCEGTKASSVRRSSGNRRVALGRSGRSGVSAECFPPEARVRRTPSSARDLRNVTEPSVDPRFTISSVEPRCLQALRSVSATETDELELVRSCWSAGGQEDPA
ncbi:hypothetical protein AOLI_G00238640 [Acnodon oligacanthus]